jgi:hypothetical protein
VMPALSATVAAPGPAAPSAQAPDTRAARTHALAVFRPLNRRLRS